MACECLLPIWLDVDPIIQPIFVPILVDSLGVFTATVVGLGSNAPTEFIRVILDAMRVFAATVIGL